MLDGRKNWITLGGIAKDRVLHLLFRKTFFLKETPECWVPIKQDITYYL